MIGEGLAFLSSLFFQYNGVGKKEYETKPWDPSYVCLFVYSEASPLPLHCLIQRSP